MVNIKFKNIANGDQVYNRSFRFSPVSHAFSRIFYKFTAKIPGVVFDVFHA